MLIGILTLWFVLTFLSLIFVAYDLFTNTPEPWVMKIAWLMVILYTGPIGLFIYFLSCRQPMPGTHAEFIKPMWKQATGSEVHCLAGDVAGIIVAAVVISFVTDSAVIEAMTEYLAGFLFGLFIFQALFMKDMMGGSYWKALTSTFMPEWLSMNLIMAPMIPTLMIWRVFDPSAANPATLSFWGSISLGSILAGISAYPMNYWLVKTGLKHGMTTVEKSKKTSPAMAIEHGEHAKDGEHAAHAEKSKEHKHKKPQVSTATLFWMTILSLAVLALGAIIAGVFS